MMTAKLKDILIQCTFLLPLTYVVRWEGNAFTDVYLFTGGNPLLIGVWFQVLFRRGGLPQIKHVAMKRESTAGQDPSVPPCRIGGNPQDTAWVARLSLFYARGLFCKKRK